MLEPLNINFLHAEKLKVPENLFRQAHFDSKIAHIEQVFPKSIVKHHGQKTRHVAVVFFGLAQSPNSCTPLIDALFERNMNVLCFNGPRGFAEGTKRMTLPTGETLSTFCEKTIQHASWFGDNIATFGYSKGAIHALACTARAPLVTHCTVVAPATVFGGCSTAHQSLALLQRITDRECRDQIPLRKRKILLTDGPEDASHPRRYPTDLVLALFEYVKDTVIRLQNLQRNVQFAAIGSNGDHIANFKNFLIEFGKYGISMTVHHLPDGSGSLAETQAVYHHDLSFNGRLGPEVVKACITNAP